MTTGIYKLVFIDNSFYIGKSVNIERRFTYHKWTMRCSLANTKIQSKYENCGYPSLEIIEECSTNIIDAREIYWINKLNAQVDGLNTNSGGNGASQGQYNSLSKYTLDQIIEVFYLLTEDTPILLKDIEKYTNVSRDTVSLIATCKAHLYLKDMFPARFSILQERVGKRSSIANNTFKIKYPRIKDPTGKIHDIDNGLSIFAKNHALNKSALCQVLKGKLKQHKGWELAIES